MEEKAVYLGDNFMSNFNDLFRWSAVLVASVLNTLASSSKKSPRR